MFVMLKSSLNFIIQLPLPYMVMVWLHPAFLFELQEGLSGAPTRLFFNSNSFSRARPNSGLVTCNNAPDLTRTDLGIGFGSSQKHPPAVRRPFSRTDHGSRPAFCIQKSPRHAARAHTLCLLCARRSACCKTSFCPAALSRRIAPMRPCTRKGKSPNCKAVRCLSRSLLSFSMPPLVLGLQVNQGFLAESRSCQCNADLRLKK